MRLNATRGEERAADGITVPGDRIPPLNGRLALTWRPTAAWRLEPFIDFAGRQDRLSPRDVIDPRIDPNGTAGWATLNVHAQWRARPGLILGLRLDNLLDESYREHGSGIDGPGRNVGLWADAQF
jgi:outer membrane receptor protein involved in Fe transport